MKKLLSKMTLLFISLMVSFYTYAQTEATNTVDPAMELVFILDRSGSMNGLESDTIGGFNAILNKQRQENKGQVFVTTVLFDDQYELLHNRILIDQIAPITEKEYYVRGNTALLDALGKTIAQMKANRLKLSEKERATTKVLFVITTDGQENSSREYSLSNVKAMVETQKTKENWEFLFLGANIDAIGTAESFGIPASKAVKYKADSKGIQKNYQVLNEAVSSIRSGKELQESWKTEIEQDYQERQKEK